MSNESPSELAGLFSGALLESRIRGERTIAYTRLVLAALFVGVMAAVFTEQLRNSGLSRTLAEPLYWIEAACALVAVGISVVVLRITAQRRYRPWMAFVPSFLDVSYVGATMWMYASIDHLSFTFSGATPWVFMAAIAVSAFRYSSASVIFTGAYSAAVFWTISLVSYARMGNFTAHGNVYSNSFGQVVRLDVDDEVIKGLVILLVTGVLTVASERFKRMLHDQIHARIERERSARAASAAEAASAAKSAFLANVSHELRTPLNAIIGFGRLLERSGTLNDEQRSNLDTINGSASQLLSLINEVLDLSRIEAGRVELTVGAMDLLGMLEEAEDLLAPRARERGLSVRIDVEPGVPRYITADRGKLRQVMINLLGNAIKFTERGGVTVRVRARGEPDQSVRLFFEVEDTGVGIAPGEVQTLFEPFARSRSAEGKEGAGLGLSICRRFVSLMGGTISVQSEPGNGSRFRFDVRVEIAQEGQIAPRRTGRGIRGLVPGQLVYRVLVAEDRASNRELLAKTLSLWGFQVRTATNGAECVSTWEEWRPHAIFMDMRMPVMDGYEATRRIKSSVPGQATVVIALTASAFDSDRSVILAGGCDDFLRKPFVEEDIGRMLEKHLGVTLAWEQAEPPVGPAPEPAEGTAALLRPIDARVLRDLRQAALISDYAQLKVIIAGLRPSHPQAADALALLVRSFDYPSILAALDGAGAGAAARLLP